MFIDDNVLYSGALQCQTFFPLCMIIAIHGTSQKYLQCIVSSRLLWKQACHNNFRTFTFNFASDSLIFGFMTTTTCQTLSSKYYEALFYSPIWTDRWNAVVSHFANSSCLFVYVHNRRFIHAWRLFDLLINHTFQYAHMNSCRNFLFLSSPLIP